MIGQCKQLKLSKNYLNKKYHNQTKINYMTTLQRKNNKPTDYIKYIENLPFEAFIFTVSAKSPTEASGDGIINESGEISFRVRCKLDLVYTEKGDKYGFSYNKSYTELLEILDSDGKPLKFTESENVIIRNFLNHKIVFSIKRDF